MENVLEICAGDIGSVLAATEGGAHRVELCSALEVGGLTPSEGFIRAAATQKGVKCHVLIRPRGGDFVYSHDEVDIMLDDIATAARCGASGVVIGALTPDNRVDSDICAGLIDRAKGLGLSVTFHRAFDCVSDPSAALDAIVSMGADRLLTSGMARSAMEGVAVLKRLNERAAGRITLIAAAGVSSANAAEVVRLSGCHEIHASARKPVRSSAVCSADGVCSEFYSDTRLTTDAAEVKAILKSIQKL